LAFDKANYVAGEQATITLSPVDATGLVLSGKTYANHLLLQELLQVILLVDQATQLLQHLLQLTQMA
jgi:hypothetical protein